MPQTKHKFKKTIAKDVEFDYLLSFPKGYKAKGKKKYPLVMFLHGLGERGSDVDLIKKHGIAKLAETQSFDFITLSPQCANRTAWCMQTQELHALLLDVIETHNVDTARIYLTGLSMGGFGTWKLACAYPKAFAAIAPICGAVGDMFTAKVNHSDLDGIERLANVPVWVFHGTQDEVVHVGHSISAVQKLTDMGGNVRFTFYPSVTHDSWTETYENPELYEWLMSHTNSTFEL
jgi:predicted peptidase